VNYVMTYGIKAPFNRGYKAILLVINKWLNIALAPIESGINAKSHISLKPIECASNAAPKTPFTMSPSKGWLSRAKASTSVARTEFVGWAPGAHRLGVTVNRFLRDSLVGTGCPPYVPQPL
jgi:hypothetical protein